MVAWNWRQKALSGTEDNHWVSAGWSVKNCMRLVLLGCKHQGPGGLS